MSQQSTDIDAPWAANLILWVSSNDAPVPPAIGKVFEIQAGPPAHPFSTNSDHTGLRQSLDQFRLPRAAASESAA